MHAITYPENAPQNNKGYIMGAPRKYSENVHIIIMGCIFWAYYGVHFLDNAPHNSETFMTVSGISSSSYDELADD